MLFLGSLNPTHNRILNVLHRFEFGSAIGHATGKVRHRRDKSAAVFLRKRFVNDLVVRTLGLWSQSRRRRAAERSLRGTLPEIDADKFRST